MKDYSDIIGLEHYEPKNHKRMSMYARAAQFAPFAALTGYEEEIEEEGRLTNRKVELSEYEKNILDNKVNYLKDNLNSKVKIIYFIKDLKKEGGSYNEITTNIKIIDSVNKYIKLKNNDIIDIENIYDIVIIDEKNL